MKQQSIILIIVVVFMSAAFSLVLSNFVFASPKNRQEKVEIVDPISADFKQADPAYFNVRSVDPTKTITIGPNSNPDPFNNAPQ